MMALKRVYVEDERYGYGDKAVLVRSIGGMTSYDLVDAQGVTVSSHTDRSSAIRAKEVRITHRIRYERKHQQS